MKTLLYILFLIPAIIFAQEDSIIFNNTEVSNHTATDGLLYYDRNYNTGNPLITGNNGGGLRLYNTEDGWGYILDTNNMRWITPNSDGGIFNDNVGIGTTNPTARLQVDGITKLKPDNINNNYLQIQSNSTSQINLLFYSQNQAKWNLYTDSTKRLIFRKTDNNPDSGIKMVIDGNNVGIGTGEPTKTLEVNGTFKATYNSSGERSIFMENPGNGSHRGNGSQNATGLVYRVAQNPSSGDPIFQIRSSGQAVRF